MKKLVTIYFIAFLIAGLFVPQQIKAQSPPQKMSYQAVIRDTNNVLVASTTVGMQISILQGSAMGGTTAVYVETQTPTSNINGLVSLEVGTGTVISGIFSAIDWVNGPFYIKTETDPTGGTTYTITGTSQLLSVPYAFYAKTAGNGVTTAQAAILVATSGTNTGDQDISGIATNATVITTLQTEQTTQNIAIALNTAKVGITPGTSPGQIQYWNGTNWVSVTPGTTGQTLNFCYGVPTWRACMQPVTNPSTGRIWMDRNLGATQVATSSTDAAAYGDLYQWGRDSDGHQIITSGITSTLSSTDAPGNANFILAANTPYDWRSPQNDNLWQGVSGTNNPCPTGYRLPTEAEWIAERASWSNQNATGAFASPLKLPVSGYRNNFNDSLLSVGSIGLYWSSTVSGNYSRYLNFSSANSFIGSNYRSAGFPIRCIKD